MDHDSERTTNTWRAPEVCVGKSVATNLRGLTRHRSVDEIVPNENAEREYS